jgi:hypothetical protein
MKKRGPFWGGPRRNENAISISANAKSINSPQSASPPSRYFPIVFRSAVARRPKQPISLARLSFVTGGDDNE